MGFDVKTGLGLLLIGSVVLSSGALSGNSPKSTDKVVTVNAVHASETTARVDDAAAKRLAAVEAENRSLRLAIEQLQANQCTCKTELKFTPPVLKPAKPATTVKAAAAGCSGSSCSSGYNSSYGDNMRSRIRSRWRR